jgi:hypothetical protein
MQVARDLVSHHPTTQVTAVYRTLAYLTFAHLIWRQIFRIRHSLSSYILFLISLRTYLTTLFLSDICQTSAFNHSAISPYH